MYAWLLENRDQKSRDEFLGELERPPKGVRAETGVWSRESQMAAFEQNMAEIESLQSDDE